MCKEGTHLAGGTLVLRIYLLLYLLYLLYLHVTPSQAHFSPAYLQGKSSKNSPTFRIGLNPSHQAPARHTVSMDSPCPPELGGRLSSSPQGFLPSVPLCGQPSPVGPSHAAERTSPPGKPALTPPSSVEIPVSPSRDTHFSPIPLSPSRGHRSWTSRQGEHVSSGTSDVRHGGKRTPSLTRWF